MNAINTQGNLESAKVYTDFKALGELRAKAEHYDPRALKEVAKQFEAVFMQLILKTMRDANNVLKSDLINNDSTEFYEEMYHQQLGMEIAGSGLGVAKMLEQQLNKYYNAKATEQDEIALQPLAQYGGKAIRMAEQVQQASVPEAQSSKSRRFESAEQFVQELLPHATQVAAHIGVDPKVLVAQAALETGWGRSIIQDQQGNNSHNLFAIKTHDWQGESAQTMTHEYHQGVARSEVASFRRYESYAQSFADYLDFLQTNPRYATALQRANNPEHFTQSLQAAGYATDPSYANKIMRLYNSAVIQKAQVVE